MNAKDPKHPWMRLVAAARLAQDDCDAAAPYGFATRVAALAFEGARTASLLERFAFRAVLVASLLAVASVAVNYSAITKMDSPVAAEQPAVDDAMSELLDA